MNLKQTVQPKTRPLRCMFVITSMPVGGAEVLLVNLVKNLDRARITPLICCLKEPGELGESIKEELPLFSNLIGYRYDLAVVKRLRKLFVENEIDAVVTVGAGDKMFWGRLAARYAKVPVILSALHSTGWPDGVGRLNRLLTGITDGFIAVAGDHQTYLIENENFPAEKVFMIPNGVDTERFKFDLDSRTRWRSRLGIGESDPVCGIVAALRPEKNHELFLKLADISGTKLPNAHYIIVGDGPERSSLEAFASKLNVADRVHFTGTCQEIPEFLSAIDMFALTSHNEASPVSILEAMACSKPVVAPNVGSISQAVLDDTTGYLFESGDEDLAAKRWLEILSNPELAQSLGAAGRDHVTKYGSLQSMTNGYTELIETIFDRKRSQVLNPATQAEPQKQLATDTLNNLG